jgi:tetratricopeptide (TPR) repeat protein
MAYPRTRDRHLVRGGHRVRVGLLPDADRSMLLRLWPFEGGFPLEAVLAHDSSIELLSSLVSRSLVAADTTAAPSRYRLLEIVRAYCRTHDPAPDASRADHAAFVHRLVNQAERDLGGPRAAQANRTLARELPNIRAAIAHDLDAAPEAALRTTGQLLTFWVRSGLVLEGRRLLERCLDAAPHAPARDIARARTAHAGLVYVEGDVNRARDEIAAVIRALAGSADREDGVLRAEALYYQALLQVPDGDPKTALAAAGEAHRICGELGLDPLAALAEMTRGAALLMLGRADDGRQALHAAIRVALGCGTEWTAAISELLLAQDMLASGDRALPLLRRALRRFQREDDLSSILVVLHNGARALAADGQADRAQRLRVAVDRHILRRGVAPDGQADRAQQVRAAVNQHVFQCGVHLHQVYTGGSVPGGPESPAAGDGDPLSLAATIALFESDSWQDGLRQ